MVKDSTKYLGFTVALLLLTIPLVHAEGHWGKSKASHAKVLSLNEDQQKQLEAIQKKKHGSMKHAFEQVRTTGAALMDEIAKASPDMNKVNVLQGQIKAIQAQMADDRLNAFMSIKKIMTPEQFAGFIALEKQEKMEMTDHKGKKRHGPRGNK